MGQRWSLRTQEEQDNFNDYINQCRLAGKVPVVEFIDESRSLSQNSALHLWCELAATTLNDAGRDMRVVLRSAEIPWTKESVKSYMWKPVEKAMFGIDSTTELKKADVSAVYETIVRHVASSQGVTLPAFPSRGR